MLTDTLDTGADRLIIFSDLHRGTRDGADDFWRSEPRGLAHFWGRTCIRLELAPDRRDHFREIVESVMPSEGTLGQVLAVLHEYRERPQGASDSELAPVKLMSLHGARY